MTLYSKKGHRNANYQKGREQKALAAPASTSLEQGRFPNPAPVPALEQRLFALEDFAHRCTAYLQSLPQQTPLLEVQVCEAKDLQEANVIAQQKRASGFIVTALQRSPSLDCIMVELKRPIYFKGVQE